MAFPIPQQMQMTTAVFKQINGILQQLVSIYTHKCKKVIVRQLDLTALCDEIRPVEINCNTVGMQLNKFNFSGQIVGPDSVVVVVKTFKIKLTTCLNITS